MTFRTPMNLRALLISICLIILPVVVFGSEPGRAPLFKIERNTNANIIQYDAQIGPDGRLLKKEPVVAYWIRLADKGQVQQLSWVQKTFAYGFDATLERDRNIAKLDMKAEIGRRITVKMEGSEYRATAEIDGAASFVEKIFIHATGKGMSTSVEYIELYGNDVETGEERFERFVP
ncbi:MAG: DUF4833 domain-containing protein [Gammaproteobacteria bacterium]|nr:DUF4833 domain-containing protein [Gammaproteobacteria bacterium]